MAESTTLTVQLPNETRTGLARLASHTNQDASSIGAEAITAHVFREMAIIEAIERGRSDVRAGRVVSNEEAFRQLDAVIGSARPKR